MDTFFTFLKQTMIGIVFVIFAFMGTYVPNSFNTIDTANAAKIVFDPKNWAENLPTNIATTATAAYTSITSWAANNLYIKEYMLDGIAWTIAKALVSSMVRSLVTWINSGFQGSPMFVQDLQGFLRNAADAAIGDYIDNLGGIGSFICSPFRLDVQIAVALQYQRDRIDQPTPTCTLSGIINNLEGFISDTQGSFSEGGWNDWFDITSSPETYTKYGQVLAGQAGARAAILNAKGEELGYLNFGDGFLSGKICEIVGGPGTTKKDCFISKPGKIIQEALTFNLDSGRQSLIAADEIDEVISALLGQLANMAFTGAAGLLGLSGGNTHSYTGYSAGSYVNQVVVDSTSLQQTSSIDRLINARTAQTKHNNTAKTYKQQFVANFQDPNLESALRVINKKASIEATNIINNTDANIITLNQLITDYQLPNATADDKNKIMQKYTELNLITDAGMTNTVNGWDQILTSQGSNPYGSTYTSTPDDVNIINQPVKVDCVKGCGKNGIITN